MCNKLLIPLLLLALAGCRLKSDYQNHIEQTQKQKLADLYNVQRSPLDSDELKTFDGIYYFPVDAQLNAEAQIVWLPLTGFVDLPHSGGDTRPYYKAAELHFNINGKPQRLIAYQNEQLRLQRTLFVPFADATNDKETYGGGRYVDVVYAPNATQTHIEFNLAYFPYCAYSHRYSCPIVPKENALDVAVKAGECYKVNK